MVQIFNIDTDEEHDSDLSDVTGSRRSFCSSRFASSPTAWKVLEFDIPDVRGTAIGRCQDDAKDSSVIRWTVILV